MAIKKVLAGDYVGDFPTHGSFQAEDKLVTSDGNLVDKYDRTRTAWSEETPPRMEELVEQYSLLLRYHMVTSALPVIEPLMMTSPASLNATATVLIGENLTATGGVGSYTWSLGATAPAELSIVGAQLVGTIADSGVHNFDIIVSDSMVSVSTPVILTVSS